MYRAADDPLYGLMTLPWTMQTGTREDGTQWARCAEIPHAIAYAGEGEDLDALFWDSLRASLEALVELGEEVPLPNGARFRTPLAGTRVIKIEGVKTETDDPSAESVSAAPLVPAGV